MDRFLSRAAAFALAALLAACTTTNAPLSNDGTRLIDRDWRVEQISGQNILAESWPSLRFSSDGRLSGDASCNRIVGTYVADGPRLQTSNAGLTRMACPPAIMEQERRLVSVLNDARDFRIDATSALIITAQNGSTLTAR